MSPEEPLRGAAWGPGPPRFLAQDTQLVFFAPTLLAGCVHRVELSRGLYGHTLNGLLCHSGLSLCQVGLPSLASPLSP